MHRRQVTPPPSFVSILRYFFPLPFEATETRVTNAPPQLIGLDPKTLLFPQFHARVSWQSALTSLVRYRLPLLRGHFACHVHNLPARYSRRIHTFSCSVFGPSTTSSPIKQADESILESSRHERRPRISFLSNRTFCLSVSARAMCGSPFRGHKLPTPFRLLIHETGMAATM